MQELDRILELLSKPLSDDIVILVEQAKETEGHYARLTYLLADSRHDLSLACARELKPKSKDLSEKEREVHLAAATAKEKKYVDQLEGLVKAISQRTIFAQSLIKSYGQEQHHGI